MTSVKDGSKAKGKMGEQCIGESLREGDGKMGEQEARFDSLLRSKDWRWKGDGVDSKYGTPRPQHSVFKIEELPQQGITSTHI